MSRRVDDRLDGVDRQLTAVRLSLVGLTLLSSAVCVGTVLVYALFPSLVSTATLTTNVGGGLLRPLLSPLSRFLFLVRSPEWVTLDSLFWFLVTVVTAELWLAFELWLRATGRLSATLALTPIVRDAWPGFATRVTTTWTVARRRFPRTHVRKVALVVVLCSALVISFGAASADRSAAPVAEHDASGQRTVVTAQGNVWQPNQNAGLPGGLFVLNADSNVVYRNVTHGSYWDVDPVPNTTSTVLYVAADHVTEDCPDGRACVRRSVETLNVTTDEVTVLHTSRVETPASAGNAGMIHDVDRINDSHLLIADIATDRIVLLDHRTGTETWSWSFQSAYSHAGNGGSREDWSHVNDIELLPDGRIMASPRNFDRVIFIRPGEGVDRTWTLGAEDDFEILRAQHNPDYIPRSAGGPAVVVADSENDRLVEYQRTNGRWHSTWSWEDESMNWPRDADRLPGGSTLVTDTNTNRVFEVGTHGEISWETSSIKRPYEAERLGTADESRGGQSARALSLRSRTVPDEWAIVPYGQEVKSVLDGLWFVVPLWFTVRELVAGVALVSGGLVLSVDALVYAGATLVAKVG